jgi:hypothetical protein
MTTKLGDACFKASILTACDGVSCPRGFRHNHAASIGEICQLIVGSSAGFSGSDGCEAASVSLLVRRHVARNFYRCE